MLSVRGKLVLPNLALALVGMATLGLLSYQWSVGRRAATRELTHALESNARVTRLSALVSDTQRDVLAYRFARDPSLLGNLEAADEEIQAIIGQGLAGESSERGRAYWQRVGRSQDDKRTTRRALLHSIDGGRAKDIARDFERWGRAIEIAGAATADLSAFNLRRLDRTLVRGERRQERALQVLLALVGASAALALGLLWYARSSIVEPLVAMTAAADRIAADEEDVRVQGEERGDEIGTLARALNQMTGKLIASRSHLAEAVRARDEFLSIASHELKTPLTSLTLQLEMAARDAASAGQGGGEARERRMRAAQAHVRRLAGLIEALLDVTRIRAGRLALRRAPVDLGCVVGDVAQRFALELEKARTPLQLELQPGVVGLWDRERLDQVVTNLLSNALKYAPGRPVELRLAQREGVATLQVRDHGQGIPAEHLPRLFQPFERVGEERWAGGLGLGLYIVRQVVEAQGGRVRADSAEGGGTTFTVELPTASAPPRA